MNYAEEIRKIRKRTNFTQEQLAAALGIERTNYNNIENGRRKPSEKLVLRILDVMGYTLQKKVVKKVIKT